MGKKQGRLHRPKLDEVMALGTLLDNAALKQSGTGTVGVREYLIGFNALWGIRNATPGQGPIMVGVAHPDYTAGEIEEWIEATGSWDLGDKVAQEQARRHIRKVGSFAVPAADEVLNLGRPMWTRCGWYVEDDAIGYALWAYNTAGVTLTTGAVVTVNGNAVLRPVT